MSSEVSNSTMGHGGSSAGPTVSFSDPIQIILVVDVGGSFQRSTPILLVSLLLCIFFVRTQSSDGYKMDLAGKMVFSFGNSHVGLLSGRARYGYG